MPTLPEHRELGSHSPTEYPDPEPPLSRSPSRPVSPATNTRLHTPKTHPNRGSPNNKTPGQRHHTALSTPKATFAADARRRWPSQAGLGDPQFRTRTPARVRLPRRTTSQCPCNTSEGSGFQSSSVILVLL